MHPDEAEVVAAAAGPVPGATLELITPDTAARGTVSPDAAAPHLPTPAPAAADVLTLGETLVVVRTDGLLSVGGRATLSVAGAESNVAIGLARLGHAVRWLGVVGDDDPGELVRRTLRAEAVDVSAVRVHPGAPTALLLAEPRLAGVTRILYYRSGSAGSCLGPLDVQRALAPVAGGPARPAAAGPAGSAADRPAGSPGQWPLLPITGITPALGPQPAAAVTAAVTAARAAGADVCLDVNYRSRLWPRDRAAESLRALLPWVDIVVASDDELALVAADAPEEAQVAGLLSAGVTEVVVKRGAAGATAYTVDGKVSAPARTVPVVDVVGAGDAFVAGYLSARLDGLDLAGRLDRATATAAFVVASSGDWEGLPARAELRLLDGTRSPTVR